MPSGSTRVRDEWTIGYIDAIVQVIVNPVTVTVDHQRVAVMAYIFIKDLGADDLHPACILVSISIGIAALHDSDSSGRA